MIFYVYLSSISTYSAAMAVNAEVTSSNTVGFNTTALSGKAYNATGPCFITTGSDGTFTLAEIVPTAYDWTGDYIYIINPDDCSADNELIYLDATTAAGFSMEAGWYDNSTLEPFNDVVWDLGTGFMTSFTSGLPDFTYSGEVYGEPISLDCSGMAYVMVPNMLPVPITLSQVTATGYDWTGDYLYVINPDDCSADNELIYLDATTAAGFSMEAGWYDNSTLESFADYEIAPGTGFQSSFTSGTVILNFPSAL